jgi:hypothetical protein
MKKTSVMIAAILFATTGVSGAAGQNVITHGDRTVEVLGLRNWTLQMVVDSLAKYAPQDSLHTHGCAAALRYKVGFADAAAMGFRDEDGRQRMIVVVREPQDSALVQLRPASFDTAGPRLEWAELIQTSMETRRAFDFAVQSYAVLAVTPDTAGLARFARGDSVAVRKIWSLLARHATERDRTAALIAILADPNFHNRLAAAAILGNFPDHDETWWALVEAMREDDGVVKSAAQAVAASLARAAPRAVEWAPVLPAVRAMLDGTSPYALRHLLLVLNETELPASHAAYLLAGGKQLIFDFVGSIEPALAEPAHALLVRLSGQDFGFDSSRWRAWARGLGD